MIMYTGSNRMRSVSHDPVLPYSFFPTHCSISTFGAYAPYAVSSQPVPVAPTDTQVRSLKVVSRDDCASMIVGMGFNTTVLAHSAAYGLGTKLYSRIRNTTFPRA